MTVAAKKGNGQRGPSPLSDRTQQRVLSDLLRRADAGDTAAAESLLRLGMIGGKASASGPADRRPEA